jgi:hypothetical protein
MAMKDFDFKQFLLEKGERVGLGVAAGFMVLLLIFGLVNGLSGGSATGTQAELDKARTSAKNLIDTATPNPEDATKDAALLVAEVQFDPLDPDKYRVANNFFTPSSIEDTKRRNPEILAPTEFRAELARAQIPGAIISTSNKQVAVLTDKSNAKRVSNLGGVGRRFGRMFGGRGGMAGPGGGMPPGGMTGGRMGGMGGMGPGGEGGMGGMGNMLAQGQPASSLEFVEFDKLEKRNDVRLAQTMYPQHMIVVTAAFPLMEQWKEFRRALRRRDLADLAALNAAGEAPFQFDGYDIERRVLYPDGREKTKWTDYTKDWADSLTRLFSRALDVEDPPQELTPFVWEGLTGPLPKLSRDLKYPELKLKKIEEALADMKKKAQEEAKLYMPKGAPSKFAGGGFDPTNPRGFKDQEPSTGPAGGPGMMGPGGMAGPGGVAGPGGRAPGRGGLDGEGVPGGAMMTSEPELAEQALLRFIDVNVEPGYTYQYRIKVRMLNPNYERKKDVAYAKLAKDKQLKAAEWAPTPPVSVPMPSDSTFYVVDQKKESGAPLPGAPADRERTPIQIHRWIDYMETNPDNPNTKQGFGEWSILERQLFQRGDYLRVRHESEVPVWDTLKEDYLIAKSGKKGHKLSVEYSTQLPHTQTPAVLVDFEGGKDVRYEVGPKDGPRKPVTDTSPVQALILLSDGKLILRNGQADTDDQAREDRVKEWRTWIKDVKSGRTNVNKAGQPGLFGTGGGNPDS